MKNIFIYGNRSSLENYHNALSFVGANCIISHNIMLAESCHGLILAGGGDIHPNLYGHKRYSSFEVNPSLDKAEILLISSFFKTGRPIMGICRGLQLLNVFFGGTIAQSINNHSLHFAKSHDVYHPIVQTSGFMNSVYGNRLTVNSRHRQAILKPAAPLKVVALSSDMVVEAIEYADRKIIALQFHPERMGDNGLRLFDYFLTI